MVSNATPEPVTDSPVTDDATQLKRKLVWRIGVAVTMIATLLGGLALFDYVTTSSEERDTSPPIFTEPVPVSKKNTTQALGTVTPPMPEMNGAPAAGVPESTSAPTNRLVATEEAPAHARPVGGRSRGPSATTLPAVPAPTLDEAQRQPAAVAAEKSPPAPRSLAADTSTDPARVATESPTPTPAPSAKLLSGYTVQAGGTFSDPKQAEAVYDRLAQEGIPVALEARVLVGPYRTRAEAESARVRLKTMGMDASPVRRSGKK